MESCTCCKMIIHTSNRALILIFSNFYYILLQDSISLPVLQFMPAGARTRCWLLSLHDLQLLPGNETCGPQMQGEGSRNQLSNMLRFFIHVKRNCQGSALRAFYAFSMLSGLFVTFLLGFAHTFAVRKDIVLFIRNQDWTKSNLFISSGICLHTLHLSHLQQVYGRYVGKRCSSFIRWMFLQNSDGCLCKFIASYVDTRILCIIR